MSLLERILDDFSAFCHLSLSFFQIRNALTSAEFIGFRGKNLKNRAKKFTKSRLGEAKTSDFFDTNIRTFDAKHPYFVPKKSDVSCFPAENGAKMPFL